MITPSRSPCSLFDARLRRVHAASFGQHPPLCRDHVTGQWREVKCPRQRFFGQRRLGECAVIGVPLAAGSHWLAHSDGITEALASTGGQLKREGLLPLLQSQDWTRRNVPQLAR